MDAQLQSLIDALDIAYDERMVRSAIKTFAIACGFERFAYLQAAGAEIKTFNSYPAEWQNVYLANRYSLIDPVVTTAKRKMSPFAWSVDAWPVRSLSKEQKRLRSQAIEFGIRSGITIPVEGSFGSTLMLTLASSRPRADTMVVDNRAKAERAVLCAHYRLRTLAERPFVATKLTLSPKELVCLKWVTKGKYMPEIAELTQTQHRTVQHYLDSARTKLGATNLPHAVAIANDHRLIEPD